MSKSLVSTIIIGLITGLFWIGCGAKEEQQSGQQMHGQQMKMEIVDQAGPIYYTCPNPEHKKVGSEKPGKCPECQMDLVAAVEGTAEDHDYYGCPMATHSDVRSDKPGVCAECGMDYKPLKLVKVNSDM
jgi:ssDNA-binding Zn-finger/Zn-ribbon topoisomerase 1